ncbi:MAG: ABC transporter permease [Bacillota bacterium]|jgi:ABC-type nitrate/sulfonate/bicarbonate transport system permease component
MKHKALGFTAALVVLLLVWQWGSWVLDKPFLPAPWVSVKALGASIADGTILASLAISTYRIAVSLLFSLLIGVPVGLLIGTSHFADKLVSPLIYLLYPLPKVVFLPIIVVLLGLGNLPKIVLISLVIVFQIMVTTRDSAKSIPHASLMSIKSLNANQMQIYRHLILPYCLPSIYSALRISIGIAVAILFFAETFASTDGLGYFIMDSMQRRSYDLMYGGIITMAFLGIVLYKLTDLLEHFTCRWQKYQ